MPIALALGAGAESRTSMGIAVVGGMLFGTLLTLFVIPVMYTFFTGKERVIIDEKAYQAITKKYDDPRENPLKNDFIPIEQ